MPPDSLRSPRSLRLAAGGFGAAVFAISAWHWWSFQYHTFDLAFYVQALWLALRGKFQVSLLGVPLLGNHVEPLVFLLTPLFALCPHPLLLVAVQSAALATMPCTAWRIARRLGFEEKAAFWLALTTILTPATAFVGLHEFHPEAFAAPLLLLLIEARLAGRFGWFWLWFAAVLVCKENLALLLVAWGAVFAVCDWRRGAREQWRWNLAPLLVAASWFLLCTKVITPALNGGKVDYLELYSHLGSTGGSIISGFFYHPSLALGALGKALLHGNLVSGLLLPLLTLPLLRPRWLLIGAPILLQHLLSWRSAEWMLDFHYAAPLIPLFWIAAVEAVARGPGRPVPTARVLAVACLAAQCMIGPLLALAEEVPNLRTVWWERAWKARLLAAIPPEASVTAGLPYLSHLAQRDELYSLHHVLKGLNTLSRVRYQPPPPTRCVVIDYADAATFDVAAGYYHPAMRTITGEIVPSSDRLLHDFLSPAQWSVVSLNALTVLTQGPAPEPPDVRGGLVTITGTTGLFRRNWENFGVPLRLSSREPVERELTWEFFGGERQVFPWLTLFLKGNHGEFAITKGLCAIESREEFALERLQVLVPPEIPAGRYRVRGLLSNHAAPQANVLQVVELGEAEVTD